MSVSCKEMICSPSNEWVTSAKVPKNEIKWPWNNIPLLLLCYTWCGFSHLPCADFRSQRWWLVKFDQWLCLSGGCYLDGRCFRDFLDVYWTDFVGNGFSLKSSSRAFCECIGLCFRAKAFGSYSRNCRKSVIWAKNWFSSERRHGGGWSRCRSV